MNDFKNKFEVIETVDAISHWMDEKNLDKTLEYFTEDAVLKVIEGGQEIRSLSGKKEIRKTLTERFSKIEMMFHNNGTHYVQVLNLDQSAKSSTNSMARIIDDKTVTDEWLSLEDNLIKVNDFWYVVERTIRIESKSVR